MSVLHTTVLYLTIMIVRGQMTTDLSRCEMSGSDAKYCQVQELQEQVRELKDILLGRTSQTDACIWKEVFRFDTRWSSNVRDAWSVVFDTSLGQQWSRVKKVRFAMETNQITHYVTFDAAGTDKENWFAKERILDSSYTDLNPQSPTNYFSIAGWDYPGSQRRFYINAFHNLCPGDMGWFVVIDTGASHYRCPFDYETTSDKFPKLLFSPLKEASLTQSQYISADYMVISVIF